MTKPALMIQGTGSNVGKSLLVAGLARAFAQRGIKVAPFKPQNMSNNAGVAEGGEIGRAQMLQARAAGLAPTVHMNPVLLKPESETGAQIILQGKRFGTMRAREYGSRKGELLPKVLESFQTHEADYDLILVEGAGSPAEVNLRAGDIANMGFAEAANVPVVLAGDIDRGGVIASLVGTHTILPEADRALIKGFLINKFHGDTSLFDDGLTEIETRTAWRSIGVLPFFDDAHRLPAEDILDLKGNERADATYRIAVPRLPRMANFDDLDPLSAEPNVSVVIVEPGQPLPMDADLILLPGSKSTIGDLAALRKAGWDIDIAAHLRQGKRVLGLCGGYQMLGKTIADPDGIEGPAGTVPGLGLLDVETVLLGDKTTKPTHAIHIDSGEAVDAYEIHLGRTDGPDRARPLMQMDGHTDGAQSADGLVAGTYLHGLFSADGFRRAYLGSHGASVGALAYEASVEQTLNHLANHVAEHLDLEALLKIANGRA